MNNVCNISCSNVSTDFGLVIGKSGAKKLRYNIASQGQIQYLFQWRNVVATNVVRIYTFTFHLLNSADVTKIITNI